MWTLFWDMHSGGSQKEKWSKIYIEAPLPEAEIIFYNRFGHSPNRVTCTCCGEDYSVDESESLEQATAFHRGCAYAYFDKETGVGLPDDVRWDHKTMEGKYLEEPDTKYTIKAEYKTLDEYIATGDCLMIYENDIKQEERIGSVPEQGYVWID